MKVFRVLGSGGAFLLPAMASAGGESVRNVPTLGEAGLLLLAGALVGSGLVLLRGRKRTPPPPSDLQRRDRGAKVTR
jgi:IPTL-CTERM motif